MTFDIELERQLDGMIHTGERNRAFRVDCLFAVAFFQTLYRGRMEDDGGVLAAVQHILLPFRCPSRIVGLLTVYEFA